MQELIKLAIAESKDPVVIITNHFARGQEPTVAYANQEFLDLVGYTIDEIYKLHPSQVFSSKNNEDVIEEIKQSVMKQKTWEGPIVVLNKSGEQDILYFNIVPVHNLGNEVLYYACFGKEIEEAKEEVTVCDKAICKHLDNFIKSLFAQTNYFNEINSHLPTGIWRIDDKFEIVYSNPIAQQKFGLLTETNLFDNIISDEYHFIQTMLKNSGEEQKINHMTFRIKKDGVTVWAGCDFWPVVENDKVVGFCGTIKDVSSEQQLVKQLKFFKTNAAIAK